MKTNGINVFFGKEHASVNAELNFTVQDNPAHLTLVLEKLLLDQLKEHEQASLKPGKYRLSMTMCAAAADRAVVEDPTPFGEDTPSAEEDTDEVTEEVAEEDSDEVSPAEDL